MGKPKAVLEWQNEEEGTIRFLEEEVSAPTVRFFVTGEEEAEFRLQDIVFPEESEKNVEIYKKITSEMIKCISETFLLLWNEGFEEVVLVEQRNSKIAEILDSTGVVRKIYSEYMMKRKPEMQKSTGSGGQQLRLVEEENGFICENEAKTFFCRLLPYSAQEPEERSFYLYEVEVEERKRNRGIATECLTELFRMLAADGPVTLYLQVGSYNEPAVHLYEKLGFEISEELCYYAAKE